MAKNGKKLSSNIKTPTRAERRAGYKDWRTKKGGPRSGPNEAEYISGKQDKKKIVGHGRNIDRKTGKSTISDAEIARKEKYLDKGEKETTLEGTNNRNLKRKNPFDTLLGRKKEKGLVKEKFDDTLTEDDELVYGRRRRKEPGLGREGIKKHGREQRKYVQQGTGEDGMPIKTKEKRKGKRQGGAKRDMPTEKHKTKRITARPSSGGAREEVKTVSVIDGKRTKSRGVEGGLERRYVRKGLRRQYIDPDKEGKFTYVGSGKEVRGKRPKKEKKRNPKT